MGSEPPSGAGGKPTPTLYGDRPVYSVAAFNQGVAGWLTRLPNVWVEGEVAELRSADRWSLAFLTLKDADGASSLPAVITRERLEQIDPPLVAGDRVHALGRSELFRRRGQVSFRILRIERYGLGMLLRRIEELRKALAADGLFAAERKRPLPFLPRTIGLICGTDAAARRDVVETAGRRYPPARFRIIETTVQGTSAPGLIGGALRTLDADPEVDVIVLARGGGSFEDLLPFSDERVVRAVADCATPVVSAIGHEEDTPLVDLAADVRAGTPSLAGRLIVPDYAAVTAQLDAMLARGGRALESTTGRARERLLLLVGRPAFADPASWIATRRQTLLLARSALDRWPQQRLERERGRLGAARDRLRVLGPAATLERGYAIVQDRSGTVVRQSAAVAAGDEIAVRLAAGRLAARVEEVIE